VVDYRTDLYSLAITAYEMFSGEIPFRGNTPDLIVAHAQKIPPPLPTQLNGLPDTLIDVLAKALAKDPAERYQSGLAFSMAIDAAFAQLPTNTVSAALVAGLAQSRNASPKATRAIESDDGVTTNPTFQPAPTLNTSTQPRRRNLPEARSNLPHRPLVRAQTIPLNFILPIGIGLVITFLILINTTFSTANSADTATPTATTTVTATASATQTSVPSATSEPLIIIIPTETAVVATLKPKATKVKFTATAIPVVVNTDTAIPATATPIPNTATLPPTFTLTLTFTPTMSHTPSRTPTPSNTKTAVSTNTTAPTITASTVPSATETLVPSATPIPPTATTVPTGTPP
jgi:serine/threonine protein kinase